MTILKNGTLVTPNGLFRGDLAMEDGKIARIAAHIPAGSGDTAVDVGGCIVFPGFIDGHTHLDLNNGVTNTADNFETGTRAAVCGGTTTIIDFATQDKGGTLMHALDVWKGMAEGVSSCNYAFHMAITDWNDRTKAELPLMREAGVTSFKAYFAYDNLRVSDAELLDILKSLKPIGGIIGVHCENGPVVNALQKLELAKATPVRRRTPSAAPRRWRPKPSTGCAGLADWRTRPSMWCTCPVNWVWRKCAEPGSAARPCTPRPAPSICCWRTACTACPISRAPSTS